MPYLGGGPVWNYYDNVIDSCRTYWWTNLVYVNNIYPTNYDDKCLNWTWFVAAYI